MTPSGLQRLASDARHHDEHHARQVELELRIAKLERELKSVQEYAAVAHQNGLDTYQAERTALLERIAELEDVAEAAKAHLDGSRYAPGKPDLCSALKALDALTTKGNGPNPRAWACCGHPERNHNGSCSGIGSSYGIANGVHCGCTVTVARQMKR